MPSPAAAKYASACRQHIFKNSPSSIFQKPNNEFHKAPEHLTISIGYHSNAIIIDSLVAGRTAFFILFINEVFDTSGFLFTLIEMGFFFIFLPAMLHLIN